MVHGTARDALGRGSPQIKPLGGRRRPMTRQLTFCSPPSGLPPHSKTPQSSPYGAVQSSWV
eukprot:4829974-Alexandrium_andersonii.AAC.1